MTELSSQEQQLISLYKGFDFASNPICVECKKITPDLDGPIGAWAVGKKFSQSNPRVLFVGKVSRGEDGVLNDDFFCPFDFARELWKGYGAHFWNYTRDIVGKVFDDNSDNSIENIAITNIVKCNNSVGCDNTCEFTKSQCIANLGVIREEIRCIKPTHVIFYTGRFYDGYIRNNVFDKDSFHIKRDTQVRNGNRKMPWMEAEATVMGQPVNILRTWHPERKNKEDFTLAISNWLKGISIDAMEV